MPGNNINHIGFIMDGNRRWGRENNKTLSEAYESGKITAEKIMDYLYKNKICKELSFWVLSDNNLKRDKTEVDLLFELIENNFFQDLTINKNVRFIGSLENLPDSIIKLIKENTSKDFKFDFTINLFFNYSWDWDTRETLKNVSLDNNTNKLSYHQYSPCSQVSKFDILIRTGKHRRLSNFALDLCGYSEIYFTDLLWPDFTINELQKYLNNFKYDRNCTYGK